MADPTPLDVQAGVPYSRRIRITDGKNLWANLADFEVRSQVRAGRQITSPLKADLRPFLAASFDGNDIVIDLTLTGADTRTLVGGNYDILVTDTGATDALGLRVLHGTLTIAPTTTAATDE
ncbi:hypothetical protein [Nocardioides sp. URHA0032]|uniref:hypothetical protein n=1 Tax=Nocardioides sp. URHA0032 TaxID=1380388 RepID=UPI00048B0D20|nr:hypothetical protein [Nocardioides sp. URHA0032]